MALSEWMFLGFNISVSIVAASHALFFKRTPQSALGWIAVCLMFPLVGPFFYFLFGINRVKNRARKLEHKSPHHLLKAKSSSAAHDSFCGVTGFKDSELYTGIASVSDRLCRLSLVDGNRIELLRDGEMAYPSMLEAIKRAKRRVFLSTYIFDTDGMGREFIRVLGDAAKRGVDVRVIVDGVGEFYSIPRASTLLQREGISHARFLAPRIIPPMVHINLRNHRKILVIDGETGFTGGMNIGDRHLVQKAPQRKRASDTHFLFTGSVVRQLEQAFIEDWSFCTGKALVPTKGLPLRTGEAVCRAVIDGPSEDTQQLSKILLGAISIAQKHVQIMTPYFLPSNEMISVMQTSALRGTKVEIVLPEQNNLPYIQWACNNMLRDLVPYGVELYFQPPPFVHSKIFVVDGSYAQVGSANIDPRSLLLNFELNVEIYDQDFSGRLSDHISAAVRRSKRVKIEKLNERSRLAKTRDALVWLFSPYL